MRRMLLLLAVVALVGLGGHAYRSNAAVEPANECATVQCPMPCDPTDCDPRDCPVPCKP